MDKVFLILSEFDVKMVISEGNKVFVEYEGRFEDGTVFDSSEKAGQPLEFTVGERRVIPGFEKSIIGMEKGEEKEITIEAEDAYGTRNPELVKEVPKAALPKDQEPKEGMVLVLGTPDGKQIPAMISEVTQDTIKIDLNHPLAGKKLIFKVKVTDVQETSEDKASQE